MSKPTSLIAIRKTSGIHPARCGSPVCAIGSAAGATCASAGTAYPTPLSIRIKAHS